MAFRDIFCLESLKSSAEMRCFLRFFRAQSVLSYSAYDRIVFGEQELSKRRRTNQGERPVQLGNQ